MEQRGAEWLVVIGGFKGAVVSGGVAAVVSGVVVVVVVVVETTTTAIVRCLHIACSTMSVIIQYILPQFYSLALFVFDGCTGKLFLSGRCGSDGGSTKLVFRTVSAYPP